MSFIFGPVTSRRYGRSLGVDMIPCKTCTYSCRFCQIGETPPSSLTTQRISNPPVENVLKELQSWLSAHPAPDFITLSGSGEPTLHRDFAQILRFAKDTAHCKSLLLSNGSLLYLEDVRKDAALADVVKVSLSFWNDASFKWLLRPEASLDWRKIVEGWRIFRNMFNGRLDCEVFLVKGFNDTPEICEKISAIASSFSPDTIFLNTAVRPGADKSAGMVEQSKLEELRNIFGLKAKPAGGEIELDAMPADRNAILELLGRHPVTVKRLCKATNLNKEDLLKLLDGSGVTETAAGGETFLTLP